MWESLLSFGKLVNWGWVDWGNLPNLPIYHFPIYQIRKNEVIYK